MQLRILFTSETATGGRVPARVAGDQTITKMDSPIVSPLF